MTPARPLPVFILAETLSGRTRGPANRRGETLPRGREAAPLQEGRNGGPTSSAGRWLPGNRGA